MSKFHVSDQLWDDNILAVRKKVRLGTSGDISFETPLKAGHNDIKDICPIYESHRYMKQETVENCLNDTSKDKKIVNGLKDLCSNSAFNVLTLRYDSKSIPKDKQIIHMADMQYVSSDAVVIPSWYGLIRNAVGSKSDLYNSLSGIYYEAASFKNNKPFFASIPQCMPPSSIPEVIDYCIGKLNITSFIIDSSSRSPLDGSWMRPFLRALHRYNVEKECVLYSINAYQGRVPKNSNIFEAEDFLGFGASFDIIGGKHGRKMGSEKYDDCPQIGHAKLFDANTYNYSKIECSCGEILRYKRETIKSQNDELGNIRNLMKEGNSLVSLLNTKEISKETIKKLEELKNYSADKGPRKTTLDKFI